MIKVCLQLIFLGVFIFGNAQNYTPDRKNVEQAYEKFKDTFHTELGGDLDNNPNHVLSYQPAVKLPQWLFNLDAYSSANILSIGISDPGLDSLQALQQATLRALSLAAFSKNCEVQNVSDNYYFDTDGHKTLGKFNSFTKFKTSAILNYTILQSFYTGNKEMMVLIDAHENSSGFLIHANMELFQSETSGQIMSRLQFDLDAESPDGKKSSLSWLLQETDRSFEIKSEWNANRVNIPNAKYKYKASEPDNDETPSPNYAYNFSMKYGFWSACILAMAVNMEQMETFSSQIKTMDDVFDDQFQDLTRIVYSEECAFTLEKITVTDNHLSVSTPRSTSKNQANKN